MELNVKFTTNNNQVVVTDIGTQYLEETDINYHLNQFKKSDTQSMIILSINKLKDEEVINSSFENSIEINKDGWLKIYYLVLPNKKWFLKTYKNPALLDRYDIVYYISGNKVYWYQGNDKKDSGEVLKLEDLLFNAKLPNIKTTISIAEEDKVSICNLEKCYINLCQQIFNSRGFSKCQNSVDSELIYKRDLVWMAINVIKYMTQSNQLYEVERIIELLHSCNSVCNDKNVRSSNVGCGCY